MIYAFERKGRTATTLATIAVIWTVVLGLTLTLGMTFWIGAGLLLCTLPALWDVIRDRRARVEVWPQRLVWSATLSEGVAQDIDHIRLNRRFDGSMRILIVHIGGQTTRLPPDVSPPVDAFEAALTKAGITSQRHPFLPI